MKVEQELLNEALAKGHDQNMAFALYHAPEYQIQELSEPERDLVYDSLAKDQDERMARALQQAEYNNQIEGEDKAAFVGMTGELDIAYDEEIARELQMQQWQEEEKKKGKPEGKDKETGEEAEEEKKGEESSGDEVVAIEGVDMDALKKFIAKQVESFFEEKLSEIMNPAAWAAHEQQMNMEHEGVSCDGCQASPIQGIRYKCTVCSNIDLCQTCETASVHSEHVLCKIRTPSQAPVKLICQFKGQVTDVVTKAFCETTAASTQQTTESQGGEEE